LHITDRFNPLPRPYPILPNKYGTETPHHGPQLLLIKVKVKFTVEQATKAQRGSRGIALLFL
jgi:hypothetical protein